MKFYIYIYIYLRDATFSFDALSILSMRLRKKRKKRKKKVSHHLSRFHQNYIEFIEFACSFAVNSRKVQIVEDEKKKNFPRS